MTPLLYALFGNRAYRTNASKIFAYAVTISTDAQRCIYPNGTTIWIRQQLYKEGLRVFIYDNDIGTRYLQLPIFRYHSELYFVRNRCGHRADGPAAIIHHRWSNDVWVRFYSRGIFIQSLQKGEWKRERGKESLPMHVCNGRYVIWGWSYCPRYEYRPDGPNGIYVDQRRK